MRRKYLRHLFKIYTIVFTILLVVNQAEFYIFSIIITEVILSDYAIICSFGPHFKQWRPAEK